MPDIDVSDLLLDPDFAEALTIQRRAQTLLKGRASVSPVTISPAPYGVVIPQNDAPMLRGPDQQTLPQLIQVHTQFRLRGPSKDPATGDAYQPDLIIWQGTTFVVNKVQNFSRFGAGFIQADCSSINQTDTAAS